MRGTPQQIIEKYQSLARDKATAGDRVLSEAFLQHAEHYLRILSASQPAREERSQEERSQEDRGAYAEETAEETRGPVETVEAGAAAAEGDEDGPAVSESLAVIGDDDRGSTMVETPENTGARPRRPRRTMRRPKDETSGEEADRPTRSRRGRASGDSEAADDQPAELALETPESDGKIRAAE